jgi:hypothetical protein
LDLSGDVAIPLSESSYGMQSSGGLIAKRGDNALWGFVNSRDEWVVSPDYDGADIFHEGLASVSKGGKYGFIDETGAVAIDFKFEDALYFSHGAAVVKLDSRYGLIDRSGKFVAEPEYEAFCYPYSSPVGMQKGGKVGFIGPGGDVVIDFKFPVSWPDASLIPRGGGSCGPRL